MSGMNSAQNNQPIQITKLDASRTQIDAAIDLYFGEGDSLSAYTLTMASLDVLRNLATAKGYKTAVDELMGIIVPEKQKEFQELIRKPQLFAKHADQDPDAILEFRPRSYEILLFIACVLYAELASDSTPSMELYFIWQLIEHPQFIGDQGDAFQEALRRSAELGTSLGISKETVHEFRGHPKLQTATQKLALLQTIGAARAKALNT